MLKMRLFLGVKLNLKMLSIELWAGYWECFEVVKGIKFGLKNESFKLL